MSQTKLAYKAFRRDKGGTLRFLFHGLEGSRIVPLDKWLKAKRRRVKDGTSKHKYLSGFHVFVDRRAMSRFGKLTKFKYPILPVMVRELRPKPRSSVGAWLADELYVPEPSP